MTRTPECFSTPGRLSLSHRDKPKATCLVAQIWVVCGEGPWLNHLYIKLSYFGTVTFPSKHQSGDPIPHQLYYPRRQINWIDYLDYRHPCWIPWLLLQPWMPTKAHHNDNQHISQEGPHDLSLVGEEKGAKDLPPYH